MSASSPEGLERDAARGPSLARRREGEGASTSFAQLRRDGIAFAQAYSGERWTDYNVHDPGVTLLEQLCFALTDLSYRAQAPVADFLADAQGNIDYTDHALHGPQEVLPCRATTCEDYRKVLLDAVPEIDGLWIELLDGGLYRIELALAPGVGPLDDGIHARVCDQVRKRFAQHRNLCEDLAEVLVVPEEPCTLELSVEIDGARPAEDTVAELYFRCARYVAAGSYLTTYAARQRGGAKPEALFAGPLTVHGYVEDAVHDAQADRVYPADLVTTANAVSGVRRAEQVLLRHRGRRVTTSLSRRHRVEGYALRLQLSLEHVRVHKGGRVLPLDVDAVGAAYERLVFDERAQRYAFEDLDSLTRLPEARHRAFDNYTSVQNELPANYHVGRRGVPATATTSERARAAQLRGYLAIFDQVLANMGAQLAHVRDLFSVDGPPRRTYWMQTLGEDCVAGINALRGDEDPSVSLEKTRRQFDPAADRRSRLLDYLLALHGERFTQRSLRYLGQRATEEEVEDGARQAGDAQRAGNKASLLREVARLNRDRGAGCPTDTPSTCVLAEKVAILLGLRAQDVVVLEHILLRGTDPTPDHVESLAYRLSVVFPSELLSERDRGFRGLAEETVRINCPAHVWADVHWFAGPAMRELTKRIGAWQRSPTGPEAGALHALLAGRAT